MPTKKKCLTPDAPRRIALEAAAADLERRYEAAVERAHRARWCGPTKVLANLGEHKARDLDEAARLTHALRFSGTAAERAARGAESERQVATETRARCAVLEEKG